MNVMSRYLRRFRLLGPLGLVCAASLLTACESPGGSPILRQRAREREEGVRTTVDIWARAEQPRPDRLEYAVVWIGRDFERRGELLERDIQGVGQWFQRDVDKLPTRAASWERAAGSILWGNPETIERTAIVLFY